MPTWNEIFKNKGRLFPKCQKDMPEILKLFRKQGFSRVLDFGCGYGRHSVLMARQGFEAYGFDISPVGLGMARAWAKKEGVKIRLKKGSIFRRLPYKDSFFDAAISIQAMHHGRIGEVRNAIKELGRVLKPGGMLFVSVPRSYRKKIRMIAPNTYVPTEGMEKGVVHYIFNKKTARKEFGSFKIGRMWVNKAKIPPSDQLCFVGELKKAAKTEK